MNITKRAAIVLQEIDERILAPTHSAEHLRLLRCLKTAIEGLLAILSHGKGNSVWAPPKGSQQAAASLTAFCDQWKEQQ